EDGGPAVQKHLEALLTPRYAAGEVRLPRHDCAEGEVSEPRSYPLPVGGEEGDQELVLRHVRRFRHDPHAVGPCVPEGLSSFWGRVWCVAVVDSQLLESRHVLETTNKHCQLALDEPVLALRPWVHGVQGWRAALLDPSGQHFFGVHGGRPVEIALSFFAV